jgi:hypothetical protein
MKTYGGVDVQIHIFLTWTLARGEWSASRPGRFTPGERAPGTNWIGGWVGSRACLDDMEKRKFLLLQGLEIWPLGRPARSQSLYSLSYPGSLKKQGINKNCATVNVEPDGNVIHKYEWYKSNDSVTNAVGSYTNQMNKSNNANQVNKNTAISPRCGTRQHTYTYYTKQGIDWSQNRRRKIKF